MGTVVLPKLSQTGTNEWADVEDNDKALRDEFNGNIENINIKSTAAIAYTKLGVIPACRCTQTNLAVANDTVTLLTLDTEVYDTATLHSTGSNTERITAPAAGIYQFTATVAFPSATYTILDVEILNGSGTTLGEHYMTGSYAGAQVFNVTATAALTAGQYAYVALYQVSGGSRTVSSASVTGTYMGASS